MHFRDEEGKYIFVDVMHYILLSAIFTISSLKKWISYAGKSGI